MIISHGKTILAERKQSMFDKNALRIAVVLIVIAVVGIGFCMAYGVALIG